MLARLNDNFLIKYKVPTIVVHSSDTYKQQKIPLKNPPKKLQKIPPKIQKISKQVLKKFLIF